METPITRTQELDDGKILVIHSAYGYEEQAVVQSAAEVQFKVAQLHRALSRRRPG